MADVNHLHILQAIKILVTPADNSDGTSPHGRLDSLFQNNLDKVCSYLRRLSSSGEPVQELFQVINIEYELDCCLDDAERGDKVMADISVCSDHGDKKNDSFNIRWQYTKCNLKLLLCLKISLESAAKKVKSQRKTEDLSRVHKDGEHAAPELAPDVLSFEHQKLVMTSLQFVACLGICPCLIPGVGVPVEQRSVFGKLLHQSEMVKMTVAERERQMWNCVSVLLDCLKQSTMGSLILTGHLGDILAVLLQISHAPRKPCPSVTCKSDQNRDTADLAKQSVHSEMKSNILEKEAMRAEVRVRLTDLLNHVYQPVLIRSLLMLQAGTSPTHTQMSRKRAPAWLCCVCSKMLSDCLMRPNGVGNVLAVLLESTPGSSAAASFDWKRCEAAATILSHCPDDMSLKKTYYAVVGPQIIDLLHNKNKLLDMAYLKVTVKTLSVMYNRDKQLTAQFMLKNILAPLHACLKSELADISEPVIYVAEEQLQECLLDLHKLLVLGNEPSSNLVNILDDVIDPLFQLYVYCRPGTAMIRKPVENCLVSYFRQCDVSKALMMLKHVTIRPMCPDPHGLLVMNRCLVLTVGDDGGVCVLQRTDSMPVLLESCESVTSAAVEIFKLINSDNLTAQYFMTCLKEMTKIVSAEIEAGSESTNTQLEMEMLSYNLTVLGMLSQISETFGYSCLLNNATCVLDFVKATLDRCVLVLDNTDDVAMGMFESETVTMALALLASVMEGEIQVSDADRVTSKELIPLLQRIIEAHPDPFIQTLASNLTISIATHGRVQSGNMEKQMKDIQMNNEKLKDQNKPLIEELTNYEGKETIAGKAGALSISDPPLQKDCTIYKKSESFERDILKTKFLAGNNVVQAEPDQSRNAGGATAILNQSEDSLQKALEDLKDPEIPVKGHALITLRRLVETKNTVVLEKQEMILNIFMDYLIHSDSYIYLAAIQGLTSIALSNADKFINVLIMEYVQCQGSQVKSVESRMKIGEVLVKLSKHLGEMAPRYRDTLLQGFLHTAKDPDHHIRASSLVNMAQVCQLLGHSLGSNIHQVLECVGALLRTDPEVEVRRAASMFIHQLIQGLGKDTLKILAESLKDLYRLLKITLQLEKDDVVVFHGQLALGALDIAMREFIFPELKLEKKIHILSPPSSQ